MDRKATLWLECLQHNFYFHQREESQVLFSFIYEHLPTWNIFVSPCNQVYIVIWDPHWLPSSALPLVYPDQKYFRCRFSSDCLSSFPFSRLLADEVGQCGSWRSIKKNLHSINFSNLILYHSPLIHYSSLGDIPSLR